MNYIYHVLLCLAAGCFAALGVGINVLQYTDKQFKRVWVWALSAVFLAVAFFVGDLHV